MRVAASFGRHRKLGLILCQVVGKLSDANPWRCPTQHNQCAIKHVTFSHPSEEGCAAKGLNSKINVCCPIELQRHYAAVNINWSYPDASLPTKSTHQCECDTFITYTVASSCDQGTAQCCPRAARQTHSKCLGLGRGQRPAEHRGGEQHFLGELVCLQTAPVPRPCFFRR